MINNLIDIIKLPKVKKMEITKVRVKGIRNIQKAEICFDKITALVGLNGYGKSNIMDAIDFGISFIQCPVQVKNKMMSAKSEIPILKSNAGSDFGFLIELNVESNGVNYFVEYEYEFSWEKTNSQAKITKENLKIKLNEKGQKYTSLISRDEESAHYKRSETGRCDTDIKIDNMALLINKLSAFDDLYYVDIIHKINKVEFYKERHLDASTAYDPDPLIIKGFGELELNGIQNIPRAIYFLKNAHEDKYNLLVDAFKQLFPRISDIVVKEIKLNPGKKSSIKISEDVPFLYADSIYTMFVKDNLLLQPLRFDRLSDGAKRIFLMLTYAVIADVKGLSLIAVEEPENSIHPNLLQNYLDILSQLVNNCKIIFTSHSPYIIQYLNPRSIYIGLNKKDGSVDFRKIAAKKENALLKDAVQYDKSIGDYIFNLLSTDDADESLKEYLETDE